jgi:hypothetical protein
MTKFLDRILQLSDEKLCRIDYVNKSECYRHLVKVTRQRAWMTKCFGDPIIIDYPLKRQFISFYNPNKRPKSFPPEEIIQCQTNLSH